MQVLLQIAELFKDRSVSNALPEIFETTAHLRSNKCHYHFLSRGSYIIMSQPMWSVKAYSNEIHLYETRSPCLGIGFLTSHYEQQRKSGPWVSLYKHHAASSLEGRIKSVI